VQALSTLSEEQRGRLATAIKAATAEEAGDGGEAERPKMKRTGTDILCNGTDEMVARQTLWTDDVKAYFAEAKCGDFQEPNDQPEMFLDGAQGDFSAAYDVGEGIDENARQGRWNPSNFKVTKKSTGEQHESRRFSKKDVKKPAFFRQSVEIMQKMAHPNIAKLLETFEDDSAVHVVIEGTFVDSLFERFVNSDGGLSESHAMIVMKQMFGAFSYLHQHHVCLMSCAIPENWMFPTTDPVDHPKNLMKLYDFGEASHCEPGKVLTHKRGKPFYVAPEITVVGRYNTLCDMWTCGVVMYVLFVSYPPFYADNDPEILRCVQHRSLDLLFNDEKDWKDKPTDGKDLITKLITRHVSERYTAEQALQHKWFTAATD